MKCPNCQAEENNEASECSRCSFNLDKWRAASRPAGTGGGEVSAKSAFPPSSQESGWGVWVWAVVLLAAVAVWFLNRSGQEEAVGAASFAASAAVAGKPPPAADAWRFEGKVYDLARAAPIKGVKVSFLDFETGQRFEDATDEEGGYSVDVAIRWKLGYAANLEHPLYHTRVWPGSAINAARKDRLHMGLEPPSEQAETPAYRGSRDKKPAAIDFSLFPKDLSDSEKAEAGP